MITKRIIGLLLLLSVTSYGQESFRGSRGGAGGGGSGTATNLSQTLSNVVLFTNSMAVGNTLYVRSDGNDTTGRRGRFDKPFATMDVAVSVALAGDLVHVSPGDYNPYTNLLKNKVDWYFEPGVTYRKSTNAAFNPFNDSSGAVTSKITGKLNVYYTNTAGTTTERSFLQVTNTASDVFFQMNDALVQINSGSVTTPGQEYKASVVSHLKGKLHFEFNKLYARIADLYTWENGDSFIKGNQASHEVSYGIWAVNPRGNEQTMTGSAWVDIQEIVGIDTEGQSSIAGQGPTNSRMWIVTKQIRNNNNEAIEVLSGLVYINAQKVFGETIQRGGSTLYLTAQKAELNIAAADAPLVQLGSGSSWINILEWSDATQCQYMLWVTNGTHHVGGGGMARVQTNDAVVVTNGTLTLRDVAISTQGADRAVVVTAGGVLGASAYGVGGTNMLTGVSRVSKLEVTNRVTTTLKTLAYSGTNVTVDWSQGNHFYLLLTNNAKLWFTNAPGATWSETGLIDLVQDGSGSRLLYWDSTNIRTNPAQSVVLSTAANSVDDMHVKTDSTGTNFHILLNTGWAK